jgi:hypothetical protein
MEYGPEDYAVDYLLVRSRGPGRASGAREDTIHVTGAQLMKKPVATQFRPRPWAYLLPRDAVDAAAMLRRHGIDVERLDTATTLTVDAYTVAGVSYERAYNHQAALRVRVGQVVTSERTFPAGTYVVQTAQYLGRLVAQMLEPETDDNVIYWNTMDAWVPRPDSRSAPDGGLPNADRQNGVGGGEAGEQFVPIYKLMRPTPLSASLVE